MPEFTLDDGRKAEKVEISPDSLTKVTEVYVEPKPQKRLSQRVTEKFCVCEREVETIDEDTGEVISKVVERLCGESLGVFAEKGNKSPVQMAVEKRIKGKFDKNAYILGGLLLVQMVALVYVIFFM